MNLYRRGIKTQTWGVTAYDTNCLHRTRNKKSDLYILLLKGTKVESRCFMKTAPPKQGAKVSKVFPPDVIPVSKGAKGTKVGPFKTYLCTCINSIRYQARIRRGAFDGSAGTRAGHTCEKRLIWPGLELLLSLGLRLDRYLGHVSGSSEILY